jgi:hypothetical protein
MAMKGLNYIRHKNKQKLQYEVEIVLHTLLNLPRYRYSSFLPFKPYPFHSGVKESSLGIIPTLYIFLHSVKVMPEFSVHNLEARKAKWRIWKGGPTVSALLLLHSVLCIHSIESFRFKLLSYDECMT